jgi:hypothetical protein
MGACALPLNGSNFLKCITCQTTSDMSADFNYFILQILCDTGTPQHLLVDHKIPVSDMFNDSTILPQNFFPSLQITSEKNLRLKSCGKCYIH